MARGDAALTDLEEQVLTELLLAPSATEDFVPVGTHRLGKRFGVRHEKVRETVLSLEKSGLIEVDFKGERVCGAKVTEKGRMSALGDSRKPIMSQPDGRGKLYTRAGGGTFWEGTYEMPNGKMNRKRFRAEDTGRVKEFYADWCREQSEELGREMKERVRPKPRKEPAVSAEGAADAKAISRKEKEMGKDDSMDKIYTIQIVGGASIAWTESFDKAVAVCDALTLAAKASGFAAKYDVVEVKRWTA